MSGLVTFPPITPLARLQHYNPTATSKDFAQHAILRYHTPQAQLVAAQAAATQQAGMVDTLTSALVAQRARADAATAEMGVLQRRLGDQVGLSDQEHVILFAVVGTCMPASAMYACCPHARSNSQCLPHTSSLPLYVPSTCAGEAAGSTAERAVVCSEVRRQLGGESTWCPAGPGCSAPAEGPGEGESEGV
jgi:hypothetical protein